MLPEIAVIVIFAAIHLICSADGSKSLHILAVVSTAKNSHSTGAPWTEGEKMLLAANRAAKDVNSNPAFSNRHQVGPVVPVLVPNCDPVKSIDKLLEALHNSSLNMVAVVGMACDAVARAFSPIVKHWPQNLLLLGSSLRTEMENPKSQHRLLYELPSHEDVAGAVISLLLNFNWTRVGIIHALTGYGSYAYSNYQEAASALQNVIHSKYRHVIQVGLELELPHNSDFEVRLLLNKLKSGNVNILVTFLPPQLASTVLIEAAGEGSLWPRLTWITVHTDPNAISLSTEWKNTIFMSFRFQESERMRLKSNTASTTPDFYSSLLYSSVQALASAINGTLAEEEALVGESSHRWTNECQHNFSFSGKVEQLWSQTQFEVNFVKGNRSHVIGHYSFSKRSLNLNHSLLGPLPTDRFEFVTLELPKGVYIALQMWISLMYALVALNFFLYLTFRKEHEVKATSVTLSMLMFLGSVLMLSSCTMFLVLIIGARGPTNSKLVDRYISCNLYIALGAVGFDVIVTTATVKMLRVWHIFRHFGRLGKKWTDSRLVCIILVSLSAKVLVFMLWIATDTYHVVHRVEFQAQETPPYFLVVRACECRHYAVWLAAGLSNTALLFALLFVLAIRTRKVNRKDFNDTKKTIAMIILQIGAIVSGILVQKILTDSDAYLVQYVTLGASYSIGVFTIQAALFLPKVTPPLGRFIMKKICIHKN